MDPLASYIYSLPQEAYHLSILTFLYLVCWYKSLYGGVLIDDDQGIFAFSDKFRPAGKDNLGNEITELKVDYYNQETGKDKDGKPIIRTFKNLQYNTSLGFPGAFMRWHRLHIGKKFSVIAKNKNGHEVYGFIQSPFRHHMWSLIIHYINILLIYSFTSNLFGKEVAFLATALFSIHPVSSQCVAWISGINYIYSLLFALINFNLVQYTSDYWITIPLTVFLSFASGMTLLTGCFNWVILILLGRYWEAFASACVSVVLFLRDGSEAVNFRKKNFKEQNMQRSTFFNFRKPIVVLKTLWYYLCLVTFPIHLGLYHKFGYHYDDTLERFDPMFWKGLLGLTILILATINLPFIFTFSIIWFLIYWLVFSNIITANQFVVERYIFIPSLGFCLILAYLLQSYQSLIWFIIGLYMARSMLHIWTYKSHKDFYWSNWLNFRDSEVALGNLGVCFINEGKTGSAIDTWNDASKVNPFYDVSWYNLYSVFKSHGMLNEAKNFLENCLKAKTVHFKDTWEKEYKFICDEINRRKSIVLT